MTDDNLPSLPPTSRMLPDHSLNFVGYIYAYTADQMRLYALDAIALRLCGDEAADTIERLRAEVEQLKYSHPAEGTVVCTCNSYPHMPNCGLDERLVLLRARVAALEGALPANIESFYRAASIFNHYEKLHRAKGPEGAEKAERNAEYAGYFHAEANALRALLHAEQEGKDHDR